MDGRKISWVFPAYGHSVNKERADYGHPSHRGFSEAISAEPLFFPQVSIGPLDGTFLKPLIASRQLLIPKSDIFVLENADALYAAPHFRAACPNAKIVLLAAHRMFGLESYHFASDPFPTICVRQMERYLDAKFIRYFIRKHIDGIITISQYVADYIARFAPETPSQAVHPYIQPSMVQKLDQVVPSLDENHALTVCEARDHKGVDLLVEAWPAVRKAIPNATLHIVGKGHPEAYNDVPGVTVCGYVDDLVAEFANASLYIHPARADAFGVSVLEAMRASVVPLVTNTTGSYPFVADVDERLVVDPASDAIRDGVVRFFGRGGLSRNHLSKRSRMVVEPFVAEKKCSEFASALESLIGANRNQNYL